jgi:hypothetical protein
VLWTLNDDGGYDDNNNNNNNKLFVCQVAESIAKWPTTGEAQHTNTNNTGQ